MSRVYTVPMSGVTVTNSTDLAWAFVNPPTTASLEILRCWASQFANATSAQQPVYLATQVTAFPTLSSTTPVPVELKDPASIVTGNTTGAAGTAGTNASVTGAGAKTKIIQDAFNVLNGYLWVPTPRELIVVNASAASGFGLYAPTAPATLTSWNAGLIFAER